MKAMSTFTCSVLLLVFSACEECRDRAGKEQVQISQSNAIESIAMDNAFRFSKSETGSTDFYSTGWTDISKATLDITVYSGAIATPLVLKSKTTCSSI